jgi:hypothetical protein
MSVWIFKKNKHTINENNMKPELNEEFTWWYERVFLQSPKLCELKYDDEKLWEAWKAGYKLGCKNVEL